MPIAASARARPRGLDREELQDRIRTRRPGDATFRRGLPVGEGLDEGGRSAYRPYRPEPEDELLHPGAGADDSSMGAHVDNTPAGFDDRPPPPVPPPQVVPPSVVPPPALASRVVPPPVVPIPVVPPPVAQALPDQPPPAMAPPAPEQPAHPEPSFVERSVAPQQASTGPEEPDDGFDGYDGYDDRYAQSQDDRDRPSGGMSALAIGGFVLLGILAIGVGAVISGVFSGGVPLATPSPTPIVTAAPTATPQVTATPIPSASEAASPSASQGPPFTFPDGFTARTEPCLDKPTSQDGCGSSGASISGGEVWVWVGFRNGTDADLLGVTIVDAAGAAVGDSSLALSSIGRSGCGASCNGYAYFKFGGLGLGNYTIRIDRNGLPAAEATFTVTG